MGGTLPVSIKTGCCSSIRNELVKIQPHGDQPGQFQFDSGQSIWNLQPHYMFGSMDRIDGWYFIAVAICCLILGVLEVAYYYHEPKGPPVIYLKR
jgi:hypothetical protein